MNDDTLAPLHDIRQAGAAVYQFIKGKRQEDYLADDLLRSAVERKFEIMGEALNRIRKTDLEILSHICNTRDIVSFRNILVHGYDAIDDRIVWGIIQDELGHLISDVGRLLDERG